MITKFFKGYEKSLDSFLTIANPIAATFAIILWIGAGVYLMLMILRMLQAYSQFSADLF
jgi:hypothetical protein